MFFEIILNNYFRLFLKSKDYAVTENDIQIRNDKLNARPVYRLYDLTEDQIKVVEGE